MKVALVTNIPAPYRIDAWNAVARELGNDFMVFFCSHSEPNRKWDIPEIHFQHVFLKENYTTKNNGTTFVHNNKDVWKHLKQFNPDVVITGGFNPTMLYSFLFCLLRGKKHIPVSDAWKMSEQHLSFAHKLLRKIIFKFSHAFIACSQKGKTYYESYNLKKEAVFISHYTINNEAFKNNIPYSERPYDLLFSGQFTSRKNPFFFIEVAQKLRKTKSDLKILLLGDGPLKEEMLGTLSRSGINFSYPGYASQKELPEYYRNSKLFLFPTEYDAWGVVANEALASSTPVLVTPMAGCSDELVLQEINGYILPPDADEWAKKCFTLLNDPAQWSSFSDNAQKTAAAFNHERAAMGLLNACRYAYTRKKKIHS